jgi:hypothetical protein
MSPSKDKSLTQKTDPQPTDPSLKTGQPETSRRTKSPRPNSTKTTAHSKTKSIGKLYLVADPIIEDVLKDAEAYANTKLNDLLVRDLLNEPIQFKSSNAAKAWLTANGEPGIEYSIVRIMASGLKVRPKEIKTRFELV